MKGTRWTALFVALVLFAGILWTPAALAAEHAHRWAQTERTEPTCEREGSVTYYCRGCDQERVETLPKLGHRYGGWKTTKEATCTEQGERQRKCSVCGHVDKDTLDRLPHSWGDWTVLSEPTDHSAGSRTHTCSVCGAQETVDYDPEGTLRRGSRGEEVRQLQEGLICYGLLEEGGADGSYGQKTERAVRSLQQKEGLAEDGVAWPQTLAFAQHDFSDWEIVEPLTREADGARERICRRCGKVERETLAMSPVYRRGDRGKPIEFIQTIVGGLGYDVGRIDGIYGPRLDAAIANWGRDHDWYFEPGLIRPADVDRLVEAWTLEEPAERIGISGEGKPVNLKFHLSVPYAEIARTGEQWTFDYYVNNEGTEDCTLGPVMISYSRGGGYASDDTRMRYVGDINGNVLRAGGEDYIYGKLTVTIDPKWIDWDGQSDMGVLHIDAWVMGTSVQTGKRWYSNIDENDLKVAGLAGRRKLVLTAGIANPQEVYHIGDTLEIDVSLKNETGEDLSDARVYSYGGGYDYYGLMLEEIGDLPAGETWSKRVSRVIDARMLYDNDVFVGMSGSLEFEVRADAKAPVAGEFVAVPVPLSTRLEQDALETDALMMTAHLQLPAKDSYAPGDEVIIWWSMSNPGPRTLMVDGAYVSYAGQTQQLHDGTALHWSDYYMLSWTVTLEEDWISDGAWTFEFFADGHVYEGETKDAPVESNVAVVTLPVGRIQPSSLFSGGPGAHLRSGGVPDVDIPGDSVTLRSLEIVDQTKNEDDYYDGAKIPVRMRLTIDEFSDYDFMSITVAPGDSVSDMDWMSGPLKAGESYEYTYLMSLDPEKTGWKTRWVTVRLHSHMTDKAEQETCEVRPPFTNPTVTLVSSDSHVIDFPAFIYLETDLKSLSGYPKETIDIPVTVSTRAAGNVSDVTLVCDTDWYDKGFYHDTRNLASRMGGGDRRTFICHVPVRALEDRWDGYSVTLYVTGNVLNVKGKVEKIESLPVTLPLKVINREDEWGKLQLFYFCDPYRETYTVGDVLTLRLRLKNAGTTRIEGAQLFFADYCSDIVKAQGDFDPVPEGGVILPDEEPWMSYSYTVTEEDAEKGEFDLSFAAKGKVAEIGQEVRTNFLHCQHKVTRSDPEQSLSLTARVDEPMAEYPVGASVECTLTVTNNSDKTLDRVRIYAVGDNRAQVYVSGESWADLGHGAKGNKQLDNSALYLAPGQSRDIKVPVALSESDAGKTFRACWIVDGEMTDHTAARSNVAMVILQTGEGSGVDPETEGPSMTLNVEQLTEQADPNGWHDGDVVSFKVSADFIGDELQKRLVITAQDQISGKILASTSAEATWSIADELQITLDASSLQDGEFVVEFIAVAFPEEGSGSSAISPGIVVNLPMDMTDATVQDLSENGALSLEVKQLTECPDPEGYWHDGDTVTVSVKAVYKREDVPNLIQVHTYDGKGSFLPECSSTVYEENVATDEFEIVLDDSSAVDGFCTYTVYANVFTTSYNVPDYTDDRALTFEMALGGTGPDGEEEPSKIEKSINWSAIDAFNEVVEAAEGAGDGKADASEKPEAADKAADGGSDEKSDTTEKPEVADKTTDAEGDEKADTTEKPETADKTADDGSDGKSDTTEKPEVADKTTDAEGDEKADTTEKPEAADKAADGGSDGKSDTAEKQEAADKTTEAESDDKTDVPEKPETADNPGSAIEATGNEGDDKPDASEKTDGAADLPGWVSTAASTDTYTVTYVTIQGDDYGIPATVCMPTGDGPFPAVVMLHGTGSTRDEAGNGYLYAAPVLAEKYGIATIRIDFPGNGESKADYTRYNFRSAVADAVAAAEYMAGLDNIDGEAIGVMGWSQGGTDALLCCAWHPEIFKSIVTWAGAPEMMLDGFFSEADYYEALENGFFVMEFDWRDSLNVSLEWCEDVMGTDVLEAFRQGYDGPVLAIAGDMDTTVDPEWSEKIAAASDHPASGVCIIEGMDHTFNVFSEADLHSLRRAVEATGSFFADTLCR